MTWARCVVTCPGDACGVIPNIVSNLSPHDPMNSIARPTATASRRTFLQTAAIGAAALGFPRRGGRERKNRSRASRRRGRSERVEGLEADLRPQDPRRPRRLRRLPVRRGVRVPGPSQRRGRRRQRPDPRPLRRAGQGVPLREDVPVAGRDGEGRHDRGGLRRHRRAQPREALHRGAQARQARRLRRAGRASARSRRPSELFEAVKSSGRKYMMFETSCYHDDLPRDAADLPRRRASASSSTPRASTTTTWPSRSTRSKAGGSACRRSGIRRTPTPTTSA